MKKLLLLAVAVTASFAHLHTGNGSSIMENMIHIVSEPDHILIVAAIAGAGFIGYKKLVKVKS